MKTLVTFTSIVCLVLADPTSSSSSSSATATTTMQDIKTKSNGLNTIQAIQKPEYIYQPIKYVQPQTQQAQIQIQPQYVPIQIIPKPYYVQQPQPAMVIIAQPALLPSSLVYGNPMQQLLNYFHNNPQAKYQLLHGSNQQSVQPAAVMMHQTPVAAQSIGNYIIAAPSQYQTNAAAQYQTAAAHYQPSAAQYQASAAQYQATAAQPQAAYHVVAAPTPQQLTMQPIIQAQHRIVQQTQQQQEQLQQQQQQQKQPTQLTQIAQLAQLAAQQYASSPLRSTPPIVTGFENFTPEQQAQIKAQLGAHLGTNFHAVTAQYSNKYAQPTQAPNEFTSSQQIKNDVTTTSSSNNANTNDILKTNQYSKG